MTQALQNAPAPDVVTKAMRAWTLLVGALLVVMLSPMGLAYPLTEAFFRKQDLPFVVAFAAFWALALAALHRLPTPRPTVFQARWRFAVLLSGLVTLIAAVGSHAVYLGYALSMDEFMATFDAAIFRRGAGLAPVAPEWRPYIDALAPMFRLQVPGNAFWVSSYLPINGLFLSIGSLIGAQGLVNAAWAGASVASTFGVARHLWPQRHDAAFVAAVLLATSSQVLVTAMTPYAMSAHLALNMLWLLLIMRGGRRGHGAAAVVALLATGLHQLIFHPLFAAPFVLQMWLDRRWRAAAFHTAAYAAICLFWVLYWSVLLQFAGLAPQTSGAVGGGYFLSRVGDLLATFDIRQLPIMAMNMLRFVAWQNPLAVALGILGVVPAWRAGGILRGLVLGFALTLVAMFVLLAYQGHGWGYRYLHGLLGGLGLLAAFAWIRLTEEPAAAKTMRRLFVAAAAASLLGAFPVHAWMAHRWVAPYAAAMKHIRAAPADIVLVDPRGLWFGIDLVRNDPYLEHGPKVMYLGLMDEPGLDQLCRRYRVAVFDARQGLALGLPALHFEGDQGVEARLRHHLDKTGCG